MKKLQFLFFVFSFLPLIFLAFPNLGKPVFADARCDPTTCASDDEKCLNDVTIKCQEQIQDAQKQEKTLKSQLDLIDGQTQITQLKIEQTQLQIEKLKREITDLSGRIGKIGTTLDSLTEELLNKIVQTYKYSSYSSPINLLLSSQGFSDLLERLKYIQVAQAYDKQKLYELQATKMAYHDQQQDKQTRQAEAEKLNKDLQTYQTQLADQKKSKNELLSETQNDEATYQKLLAQARAQLAGFSSFAASRGGASILSGQTVCDDWGCYYNQRDSQWGMNSLNGTGYTLASDGCLVTSVAMVFTHYGHKNVTPQSINSNSGNFAAYEPAFLNRSVSADGATLIRDPNHSVADIDSLLSSGPIIVGMRYANGDTHFVVLVSGSGGNYKMNDPFIPNGHNINFTDHYSLGNIFEVDKVTL